MTKKISSHTAVIYFSLSAREEAQQKSFISGKEFKRNIRIARLLRNHTKKQIEQTGLIYFVFNEHNQKGDSFGEKLVHAFQSVYAKGFENVIAVGNDTPSLEASHILDASYRLKEQATDIVLGPATDGGTWLMGFSKEIFHADTIKNFPWNSSNLVASIFQHYNYNSPERIHLLSCFDDIDTQEDLLNFLKFHSSKEFLIKLQLYIKAILESQVVQLSPCQNTANNFDIGYAFLLRGPPKTSDYLTFKIK